MFLGYDSHVWVGLQDTRKNKNTLNRLFSLTAFKTDEQQLCDWLFICDSTSVFTLTV